MKNFTKSDDKTFNFLLGLVNIFDGLVEILTLGHVHSSWYFEFVFWYQLRKMKRLAKEQGEVWNE